MENKDLEILEKSIKDYDSFHYNLPYHLNIIEELHANENAHSRILARLFQYKDSNDRHVILKEFVDYLIENNQNNPEQEFTNIQIENPVITYEEKRIDIWIKDEKYAIIIENKVYDAGDQETQLCRYIDKTLNCGYEKEKIFVIYMPSSTRDASEQTWGIYKEEFKNRYSIVSFNQDVIKWLKEKVYPNLTLKEVNLRSAIEQYIDYLERYSGQYEKKQQDQLLKTYYEYDSISIKKGDSLDSKYKKLMKFHTLLQHGMNLCDCKIKDLETKVD